jgi:hypothetical protein
VEVKVGADKPEANVVVRANRGGLVEFVVTEGRSAKPVADAGILIADARTARPFSCRSGSDGIAAIRLPAGTYSITSVSSDKGKPYPGQDFVKVPPAAEVRKQIELFAFPSVAGIAADRQGVPVVGASVQTLPKGQLTLLSGTQKGYELTRTESLLAGIPVVFTDREGKFEATWYLDELEQRQIREKYIVLRDTERDLAAAVQVDDTKGPVTVEMTPGVTVTGRLVDSDGRQIANARTTLYMVVPGWRLVIGELLTQVNETGEFRIGAVPRGRSFALDVGAAGYGVRDVRFNTEAAGATLELGDVLLSRANLQISGMVVDPAGKPVPGVRVTAVGRSDAVFHAVTDARGKFLLDNVSESEVVISAAVQGLMDLSGAVQAKSPAQDVKIVVRDAASAVAAAALIPTGPPSLRDNDLPDLKELGVELPPDELADRMILLAFWDMNQRPSRHCITQLAERAEQLKEKGVTAIVVQAVEADENTVNAWLKENNISLHTGIIKADHEKTASKWGMASLPWLILTDAEHKVRADGFGVDDIEDKIEEINGA